MHASRASGSCRTHERAGLLLTLKLVVNIALVLVAGTVVQSFGFAVCRFRTRLFGLAGCSIGLLRLANGILDIVGIRGSFNFRLLGDRRCGLLNLSLDLRLG